MSLYFFNLAQCARGYCPYIYLYVYFVPGDCVPLFFLFGTVCQGTQCPWIFLFDTVCQGPLSLYFFTWPCVPGASLPIFLM